MSMNSKWKLAIIGGGSKIVGATLCQLANKMEISNRETFSEATGEFPGEVQFQNKYLRYFG